jgi:hypothetical protein
MARLSIPLLDRTLHTTGDTVLHAELILEVKNHRGTWVPFDFVVDPGTEMTTMPASRARKRDLPIPKQPVPGLALHDQEVRRGLLRARIPGLDATEYIFPCFFLGDPSAPIADAKNLLGLTGVIDQVRLTFDGTPTPTALYGVLIVETI